MYIHSKKVLHRDLKTQVRISTSCFLHCCLLLMALRPSFPWTPLGPSSRPPLPLPHHSFQNIFIARGSIMKLGDFGIAKVLEKTDSFANTVTGTPYYMVRACVDI